MAERQRVDKWLWFARVVKTRTLAAKLVTDGFIRLNGKRIEAASQAVSPGDVLTISLERQVRILRVMAPGEKREAYPLARLLYEEIGASGLAEKPEQAEPD